MLMAVLMPSVSHALSDSTSSTTSSWAEICSTVGMKMVQTGGAEEPASSLPGKMALHAQHCPFCSLHADAVGLPPVFEFFLPAATRLAGFPSLFYQTPALQFIWSAAQSRAPPFVS